MFNKITKTILILVISSCTVQYDDFNAEDHYNTALIECFKVHGEGLQPAGMGALNAQQQAKHEEVYMMMQGIYIATLKNAGVEFSGVPADQGVDGTAAGLTKFLRQAYLWIPYHNICHAVMTMLHTEAFIGGLSQNFQLPNNQDGEKQKRGLLMGALLHDLAHPGYTGQHVSVYQATNSNIMYLKPRPNDCAFNDNPNAKFKNLQDMFDYPNTDNGRQTLQQEVMAAFGKVKAALKNTVKPTEVFYRYYGIEKANNEDTDLGQFIQRMCQQPEMSHAIIAQLYLEKAGLEDQFDMNYLLSSIIMTNMGIANIPFKKDNIEKAMNMEFKTTALKVIGLVHYADIANMGAKNSKLVEETAKQVVFEFHLEGTKTQGAPFLQYSARNFGEKQIGFKQMLDDNYQIENDNHQQTAANTNILQGNQFYSNLKLRIQNQVGEYQRLHNQQHDFDQGQYAVDKVNQYGDADKFEYRKFRI